MSYITVIIGKSLSGKSYLLDNLKTKIASHQLNGHVLITHTTRPKRAGELDGINYHFDTFNKYQQYKQNNKIIVPRKYTVANGDTWYYYLTKDDLRNLQRNHAYVILDLQGYLDLIDSVNKLNQEYPNKPKIQIDAIYLNVPLATRLEHYLNTIRSNDDEHEFVRRLYDDTFHAFNQLDQPDFIRKHNITVVSSTKQAEIIIENQSKIDQ